MLSTPCVSCTPRTKLNAALDNLDRRRLQWSACASIALHVSRRCKFEVSPRVLQVVADWFRRYFPELRFVVSSCQELATAPWPILAKSVPSSWRDLVKFLSEISWPFLAKFLPILAHSWQVLGTSYASSWQD